MGSRQGSREAGRGKEARRQGKGGRESGKAGMGRDVEEWLSGALSMEQTQKLAKVICSKILNLPLNTLVVDHLKVATHPTHPTHPTSFPPERDRADPNSIPPNILCSRL